MAMMRQLQGRFRRWLHTLVPRAAHRQETEYYSGLTYELRCSCGRVFWRYGHAPR